ncbi:MAG: hypothetical protein ACUVTQ_10650 [Desulfotomaculales bacterium]
MTRREGNELLRLSAQLEYRLANPLPDRAANARGVARTRRALRRRLKWVLQSEDLPGCDRALISLARWTARGASEGTVPGPRNHPAGE